MNEGVSVHPAPSSLEAAWWEFDVEACTFGAFIFSRYCVRFKSAQVCARVHFVVQSPLAVIHGFTLLDCVCQSSCVYQPLFTLLL